MQRKVHLIDFCLQKLFQLVTQFRFQITHSPIQQSNSVLVFQWELARLLSNVCLYAIDSSDMTPEFNLTFPIFFFLLPSRCYLWKQLDARDFHFIMIPKYKWKQTYCAIKWTFDIVVKCFSGNVIHWEQYFTNKTEKIK